jgi:Dyp-type peroxidase family
MRDLELKDIQGNIVQGYSLPHSLHLFLEIAEASVGQAFLAKIRPRLTTAAPWQVGQEPDNTLNLAISFNGLEALGVSREVLRGFPPAFSEGMSRRSEAPGESVDSRDRFCRDHRPHIWLSIYARGPDDIGHCRSRISEVVKSFEKLSILEYCDVGSAIRKGRDRFEHFGFADGLSNPVIAGTESRRRSSGLASQPTVAPGEFLLGYPDEVGETTHAPDGRLTRNGTFVVYKKLRQHVAAFRRYVEDEARRHRVSPALLAAKMIGRHQDGTPLAHRRRLDDGNSFDFANDRAGAQCPLGAHIRRANPRNSGHFPELANRHRMLRRGMPYGPPLPEEADEDRTDRGLLFIAMNASIERQYEFVQQRWMNDGADNAQAADPDPIMGLDEARKMIVQGDRTMGRLPLMLLKIPRFVESLGGEYFFMPGLGAVEHLAMGRFSEVPYAEDARRRPPEVSR